MTTLAVTNTFSSGATITASGENTNFADIVNYINNRNSGSSNWDSVYAKNASAVPLIADNSNGSVDIANFKNNGSTILSIVNGGAAQFSTGTNSGPSISFLNDSDTGFYSGSNGAVEFTSNGVASVEFSGASVRPVVDNTISMGITGKRWTDVWATNGTIQTSMASTKTNITPVASKSIRVPDAVMFTRPGQDSAHQQLGFLADGLPPEAHPIVNQATGERDPLNVYTGSVLGVLCSAVQDIQSRLSVLEAK